MNNPGARRKQRAGALPRTFLSGVDFFFPY
jgi:hypothetical protein